MTKKLQLAKSYINAGNLERARFHLKDVMAAEPNSAETQDAMGLLFRASGEVELAEKSFRRAISLSNEARYKNNYAVFLFEQKRFADARALFADVIEDVLYKGRVGAMLNIAFCELQLGNEADADRWFERVLRSDRLNAVALYQRASYQYREGNYPSAERFLSLLKASAGDSSVVLLLEYKVADKLGQRDRAASAAMKLVNMFPESAETREYQQSKQ